MPADDQDTALPCASVMVTMVLLKVAATWETPTTTFFFSFLRARGALPPFFSSAILLGHFLLAGDRLGGPLAGAGIGVGTLSADGQVLAMTQAAIAAQIHKPLDVHRGVAAQIAFHQIIAVDDFADLNHFGFGEIADPAFRRNAELVDDLARDVRPDSMNIAKADFDPLL